MLLVSTSIKQNKLSIFIISIIFMISDCGQVWLILPKEVTIPLNVGQEK